MECRIFLVVKSLLFSHCGYILLLFTECTKMVVFAVKTDFQFLTYLLRLYSGVKLPILVLLHFRLSMYGHRQPGTTCNVVYYVGCRVNMHLVSIY